MFSKIFTAMGNYIPRTDNDDYASYNKHMDYRIGLVNIKILSAAQSVKFQYKFSSNCDDSIVDNFMDSIKSQSRLRHPLIVSVKGLHESGSSITVITERCTPLCQLTNSMHELEIVLGLFQLLQTLQFLHEKAFLSHCCIESGSIFVTPNSLWKLGNFCFAKPFPTITKDCWLNAETVKELDQSEDSNSLAAVTAYHSNHLYAYDIFNFAVLALKLTEPYMETVSIGEFRSFLVTSCMSPEASARPCAASVLSHNLFKHPLVRVFQFLTDFTTKSTQEKETFFSDLHISLQQIPEEVLAPRIGPLLLSRVVLIDPLAQTTISRFLKPCKESPIIPDSSSRSILSENMFRIHIIPLLIKIFSIQERNVRMVLLSHFKHYCHLFSSDCLKTDLIEKIRLGTFDEYPPLVSLSLHALAECALLVDTQIITGAEPRGYLFMDALPKQQNFQNHNTNAVKVDIIPKLSLVKIPNEPITPEVVATKSGIDEESVMEIVTENGNGGDNNADNNKYDDNDDDDGWNMDNAWNDPIENTDWKLPVNDHVPPPDTNATILVKEKPILPTISRMQPKKPQKSPAFNQEDFDYVEMPTIIIPSAENDAIESIFAEIAPVIHKSSNPPTTKKKPAYELSADEQIGEAWNEDW